MGIISNVCLGLGYRREHRVTGGACDNKRMDKDMMRKILCWMGWHDWFNGDVDAGWPEDLIQCKNCWRVQR